MSVIDYSTPDYRGQYRGIRTDQPVQCVICGEVNTAAHMALTPIGPMHFPCTTVTPIHQEAA